MNSAQVSGAVIAMVVCMSSLCLSIPAPHIRGERQTGDMELSDLLARLGLQNRFGAGCVNVGCGIIDFKYRERRSSSDQRMAELQALVALAKGSGRLAHGMLNPMELGKRKRSFDLKEAYNNLKDLRRQRLLLDMLDDAEDMSW